MITDSFFTFACAGLIGLLFGLALTFAGYRLFAYILPIFGFVFGFALGAQTVQALFNTGFLTTVTSWVVGFFVGGLFGVLSYAFYVAAMAVVGGALGYGLVVAVLTGIGMNMGLIVWMIAVAAFFVMAFVTLRYNLQKYVIILTTALGGAAISFGTIYLMFNPIAGLLRQPLRAIFAFSPFLGICAIVVAVVGFIFQLQSTKEMEVKAFNRLGEAVFH